MPLYDAHIHFNANIPAALEILEKRDLKLLNICVATDNQGKWGTQRECWGKLARENPKRFAWITSFDLPRFDDPHYAEAAVAGVQRDLREGGAIGVKIWKNVGMEVKRADGSWFYVDDPLFTPIVETMERAGTTLLMHIAEPLACWQPLKQGTPHYGYYSKHPEWHMHNKPEFPSHEQLIASRDRLVARHPKLRMIGAHFGSLEYDVAEIAKRLEAFPNFAVDTSARLGDLFLQDSAKVRQFFIDFQDRILFGTDYVNAKNQTDVARDGKVNYSYFEKMLNEWHAYLTTTGECEWEGLLKNKGLGLPAAVVDKLYHTNTPRWYPGT